MSNLSPQLFWFKHYILRSYNVFVQLQSFVYKRTCMLYRYE